MSMSTKSFASSPVSVLFASQHQQDRKALSSIFGNTRWKLDTASSLKEVETQLSRGHHRIVVSDCRVADATWREVFERLGSYDHKPLLIVSSAHADDSLWAEVLNAGAYDVLAKPFDSQEVYRVISLAWRHPVERRSCGQASHLADSAVAAGG
jgi:DNA-binding NtrC family response regulator